MCVQLNYSALPSTLQCVAVSCFSPFIVVASDHVLFSFVFKVWNSVFNNRAEQSTTNSQLSFIILIDGKELENLILSAQSDLLNVA